MAYNVVNAVRTLLNVTAGAGFTTALAGSEGQQLASEVDGKWYQRAKSGQLFVASTGIAAPNVPVFPTIAATAPKACVIANPANSGVNLQLAEINIGLISAATAVIGSIGLMYQNPLTAPTATQNLGTITSALIGSGLTDTTTLFYSRMTYVGTPTIFKTLGINFGTTTANAGPVMTEYFGDGLINLAPGSSLGLFSSAAQTVGMIVGMTYARVPII